MEAGCKDIEPHEVVRIVKAPSEPLWGFTRLLPPSKIPKAFSEEESKVPLYRSLPENELGLMIALCNTFGADRMDSWKATPKSPGEREPGMPGHVKTLRSDNTSTPSKD